MHLNMSNPSVQIPPYIFIFHLLSVYHIPISNQKSYILMFFIPTKIKNAMIDILSTLFTYKDEGGSIL